MVFIICLLNLEFIVHSSYKIFYHSSFEKSDLKKVSSPMKSIISYWTDERSNKSEKGISYLNSWL